MLYQKPFIAKKNFHTILQTQYVLTVSSATLNSTDACPIIDFSGDIPDGTYAVIADVTLVAGACSLTVDFTGNATINNGTITPDCSTGFTCTINAGCTAPPHSAGTGCVTALTVNGDVQSGLPACDSMDSALVDQIVTLALSECTVT